MNSFPPGSFAVTDWRDADVCEEADFGFGKPRAFRYSFQSVTEGIVIVYPTRGGERENEGVEL